MENIFCTHCQHPHPGRLWHPFERPSPTALDMAVPMSTAQIFSGLHPVRASSTPTVLLCLLPSQLCLLSSSEQLEQIKSAYTPIIKKSNTAMGSFLPYSQFLLRGNYFQGFCLFVCSCLQ